MVLKKESPLNVIFMGTPDFACPALEKIYYHPNFKVIAVYTQPPRPSGRGKKIKHSPVHEFATLHGIDTYTPTSFKKEPDSIAQFARLNADIAVVAAYGLILPPAILAAPRLGCLNIHASLLPRWRGASPIQRAIEAGDSESGITIMQMEIGLDTGPMIVKSAVSITNDTTAQSLHDELANMGAKLIINVLSKLYHKEDIITENQDEDLSNYAPLLTKGEGKIDWEQSALVIDRKVRAFSPWPGGWCLDQEGKRYKILSGSVIPLNDADNFLNTESKNPGCILNDQGHIICGNKTCYRIISIQPENSHAMSFTDCINGKKLCVSERLR